MRICRAEWTSFELLFVAPFATAHEVTTVRAGLIIRLTAGDGLVALGEASPVPAFGGKLAATLGVLQNLLPRVLGRNLDAADRLLNALDITDPSVAAVACALDMALCDLRARAEGRPLACLLGGDVDEPVLVNATIGARETDEAVAAAGHAAAAGFGCVKLKVGVAGSRGAELERIAAVRAAIGPAIRLRLDANAAWDVDTAIAIIGAAERYSLELVEQPVAADDLTGMARVRAGVATPIAADESVSVLEQARCVVDAGAADVLIVKPMLAGGPRPAIEIIELARRAGLRAVVTTTIDSGVGTAAALHLATRLPAPRLACGLATGPLLAGDLITRPLVARDGAMRLPGGAGLGVTLDEAQLLRYGGSWREVKS